MTATIKTHRRYRDSHRTRAEEIRPVRLGIPAALMTVMLLAGGSVQMPIGLMTAELAGLLALGWWIAGATAQDWMRASPVAILALLLAALGAVQLFPLAPATWAALPGHDIAAATAAASGTVVARPLSLDPGATLTALLALVTGLAMAATAIVARPRETVLLTRIVVAVALLSAALGAFQIASGDQFRLYPDSHTGVSIGIFANRNHHADFLMIAMILLAADIRRHRSATASLLPLAAMAVLAVSTVMTGSRLGIAILPFAIVASLLLVFARTGSSLWKPALAVLAIGLAALLLVFVNPHVGQVFDRFNILGQDSRPEIWSNTRLAIGEFWPWGSGLGTFVPVYKTVETLETMKETYVVHAHQDYLEILLETGVFGLILLAGYAVLLIATLVRALRTGSLLAIAPYALGILILLVHSLGDYPLRVPALMTVFGLLNGALLANASAGRPGRARGGPVPQ